MRKTSCVLACVVAAVCSAGAATISGVDVAPQQTVAGQTLSLNGAGIRTFVMAFVPIRVFVAAFYAPSRLSTEKQVMASPGPLRLDFTFLLGISQSQVTEAWNTQFRDSVSYKYANFAADQKAFVGMLGPLQKLDVETVVMTGNQTQVFDRGQLKGQIAGRDFQKAFLSMWFGSTPVMTSLKSELLGN